MRKTLLLSLAFLVGCHTAEKKFNSDVESGRCETALEKIPENETGAKLISKTQTAGGMALSYAITGAAYTGEILVDAVGGTVMFVVLCGPALALGYISDYNSTAHNYQGQIPGCIPGKIDALFVPSLGEKTYKASKDLRCPDLLGVSRSIRKVAACFSRREKDEDIERASQTLMALQQSQQFYECLPEEEQQQIAKEIQVLNLKKTKL